ncbi:hypothetical protein YC2023_111981 [Brassica napus]
MAESEKHMPSLSIIGRVMMRNMVGSEILKAIVSLLVFRSDPEEKGVAIRKHFRDLRHLWQTEQKVDVPEWLSGMTRNHVGFARAGSNPAVHDFKVLFSLSFPPNPRLPLNPRFTSKRTSFDPLANNPKPGDF